MDYKTTEDLPLVMSVEDAAKILCVSRNTAYALIRSGQLPSIKVGRQYRVTKNAFMTYIKTVDSPA